jgi:hypothetical protein
MRLCPKDTSLNMYTQRAVASACSSTDAEAQRQTQLGNRRRVDLQVHQLDGPGPEPDLQLLGVEADEHALECIEQNLLHPRHLPSDAKRVPYSSFFFFFFFFFCVATLTLSAQNARRTWFSEFGEIRTCRKKGEKICRRRFAHPFNGNISQSAGCRQPPILNIQNQIKLLNSHSRNK